MDTNTNIVHSFEYAAEGAKENFLANISSLHEVSAVIRQRISTAEQNSKQGIWFTMEDAEILYKWIQQPTVNLLAEYQTIDRVNRKAMKLYKAATHIKQHRTTSQHLIDADMFLQEWDEYKRKKQKAA